MFTTILVIALNVVYASSTLCAMETPAENGDQYDKLYELRIRYFTEMHDICKSVVDEASAEEAAKKWRALLPLEIEIKQLSKKLGQPSAERQAELNTVYGTKISDLSTRSLQLVYRLANKPYYKKLHIAMLQNQADQGSEDARKALAIMQDPNFDANQNAAEAATAKIETDPETDRIVKEWIATMDKLSDVLDGVTDSDSAKAAMPEMQKLAEQLEARIKALGGRESAAASIEKHREEIGKSIMPLGMKSAKLVMSKNNEISEPFKALLVKILKLISD